MSAQIIYSDTLTLTSERKSIKLVEPFIIALRDAIGFPDELYYNILITSTEAVNNAIIHGNKCNCDKRVTFKIQATNRVIDISIIDQGCGFNPDEIADPREPDNLMKSGGRGVFLIKQLSDSSNFSTDQNGSQIKMTFFIK